MPKNNFKLFDENKSNMMTDVEYNINAQRLNGVQSGVASSQLQNKTLYQTALMCYALAQLMAANGYDANDADAVSTFVNNMSRSMVQKVVDKASADDVVNKTAGKWIDAKQLGELKENVADNYLPLLGGTMLGDLILNSDPALPLQAATKQYVDGFCKIATGSYIGTGTTDFDVNIGFKPQIIFIQSDTPTYRDGGANSFDIQRNLSNRAINSYHSIFWIRGLYDSMIFKVYDDKREYFPIYQNCIANENGIRVSMYAPDSSISGNLDPEYICNKSGEKYIWAAFGSVGTAVGDQFIFTDNQTFSIPATGKYNIEIHGAGGNAVLNSGYANTGGGSGELYQNVEFIKGQQIPVVIGKISSGDGASSFGSYSIQKGGDATGNSAGSATGSLASAGDRKRYNIGYTYGGSGGCTVGSYGDGGGVSSSGTVDDAKNGAIILTYVGK